MAKFSFRIALQHYITSVHPTMEVLERRLQKWPAHLDVDKELLRTHTCDAMAAESSEDWQRASHQYSECYRILTTNKTSISQELMLWLVKRICVPLAFINQFRRRNFKLAFETLNFMFDYVWHEYDRELTWREGLLKIWVETMRAAVLYDAKEAARDLVELEYYNWLCTGDVQDLKARCCEYLCVQYYILGQFEDVWWWLGEWKRSLAFITANERRREFQHQDCCYAEACLLADTGDYKKSQEILLNLTIQYTEDNETLQTRLPGLAREIFSRLGDADGTLSLDAEMERLKMDCIMDTIVDEDLKDQSRLEAYSLAKKAEEAMFDAREEDAIGELQRLIDILKNNSSYTEDSNAPLGMSGILCQIASCHSRLFSQKELKFFIDQMENERHSNDGKTDDPTSIYMSLKLCVHHCWGPYCQQRHCLEEEDEGHCESPTEFFTKRHIESDGNNLHHLKAAAVSLDEALDLASKSAKWTGDTIQVAEVQSFLARIHLLIAQKTYCPALEEMTPEFLVASDCHTIQQVRDLLELNDTSPDVSFQLSLDHYRQCARRFTKLLDSYKNFGELWIPMIEKHKFLHSRLQLSILERLEYYKQIHDVLQDVSRITGDQEISSCVTNEFKTLLAELLPESLLWSERGRARFLEFQLIRKQQQEIILLMEPNSKELSSFHLHDEATWNDIRSSLDACGVDTVFLEYSVDEVSRMHGGFDENSFGRVYAVKKEHGSIIEAVQLARLNGDPRLLHQVVQRLHEAFKPLNLKYVEADVIRDLEVLYQLLISPVAEFLEKVRHVKKLVICPNQILTKVPFAILRNPAEKSLSKGYLFQTYTISITPSLRVLNQIQQRYLSLQRMTLMEGQGAAVAIGDPAYKDPTMSLEDSRKEVEFIASLFPNRCAQVTQRDATVDSFLRWAKLPSEESRSQAFVHIAAHCETGDDRRKHGILRLTELEPLPCSSSTDTLDFGRLDGILSAEDIVKSKIELWARMIVLSACSSGEGELKAEGVLNLPRAFMVAGVPCSVVSQWAVQDSSTSLLMKFFYQKMLEGMDVATALQSAMQQMLDNKYNIKQWGAFMVWGLPTVCLPDELLSKDSGAAFLQIGKELLESKRYSNALLPLKKSLELMKANKDHSDSDALVQCLCWLADCEESACSSDHESLLSPNIDLYQHLKFGKKDLRDDLVADIFKHYETAIQYLSEALKHAKVGGSVAPTQLDVQKRLGHMHHLRAGWCWLRLEKVPLPHMIDGMEAVLDFLQENDISADDSLQKAFEHYVEYGKLCSQNMDHATMGSEPWISAATSRNEALLDMQKILRWRLRYLHLIKQHLIDRCKRLKNDGRAISTYTQEFQYLTSRICVKNIWLNRMYTPPWELSLGWRTIVDATWDLLETDSWMETQTLGRDCGDVVVEYVLDDEFSLKFLLICVTSQDHPPRCFVNEFQEDLKTLELVLTITTSMMSAHNNFNSHSLAKDLGILHEMLINPILEDVLKTMRHEQKLVFIPCERLAAVPFELLRDASQPNMGEGYLIQSHTISIMPSFRILEYSSQCLHDLQTLPLMPDSNASLVLTNSKDNEDVGPATIVAAQFPTQCRALHGSDATVKSLVDWAELPSSTKKHCQAFFHVEAEIHKDNHGKGVLKLANFQENIKQSSSSFGETGSCSTSKDGRLSPEAIANCGFQWRVCMAVLRARESDNEQVHTSSQVATSCSQIQKEGVLSLAKAFAVVGVPCVVMSHCPLDDASSHNFFEHLYTSLKDGADVTTAVRYSMLQMKKDGFQLNQWGAFSVFGVPTAHLPREMLRSYEEPFQNGRNLLESHRYSEAVSDLRKCLNILKASDDTQSTVKSFHALQLQCLCWLGECEESLFKSKHNQALGLKYPLMAMEFDHMLFAYQHRLEALEPDQLVHLQSAIQYLVEALEVAHNNKAVLPIDQSIENRLGLLYFLEGLFHYRRLKSLVLTGRLRSDSMQEMRLFLQRNGFRCEESWQTSAQYLAQHLNMCSNVMDGEKRDNEPWLITVNSQIETTELLLHVTRWELEFYCTIYRYLLLIHTRGGASQIMAILQYEHQILTNPHVMKAIWLERKSRVKWEIPIGRQSTRTFSNMDWTIEIGETCGKDPVILEYNLDLDVTNSITVLVTEKGIEPPTLQIYFVPIQEPQKLKLVLARLCPSMGDKARLNISEAVVDLEYMYNLLIKNGTVEPILKRMSLNQKLIIVPGKLLAMVPFALLRNSDPPQGKGYYLFQNHTISIEPSLRILEHCSQRFQILQSLPMMPGSKASLVIGRSISTKENESFNEEERIASQFPNHCVDMLGSATTAKCLLDWAELPSTSTEHCQAFVHIEAHTVFDQEIQQEVLKLADPLHPVVNLQNTDHTEGESSGTKSNIAEGDYFEALELAKRLSLGEDLGNRIFTTSSDGQLSAEAIANSPFKWCTRMVVLGACEGANGQIQAEGVLNLARAFMVAGVPCVVMSHWMPRDASALLHQLYQHMKEGDDVSTALRRAMLQMLEDGLDIKQWGAYSVFGLPTVCLPSEMLVNTMSGKDGIQDKGKMVVV